MATSKRTRNKESRGTAARNSRATVGGPADAGARGMATDALTAKLVCADELAVSLAFNPLKTSEYEPHILEGPKARPSVAPRILATTDATDWADGFIEAVARHRHYQRETDLPRVSCLPKR